MIIRDSGESNLPRTTETLLENAHRIDALPLPDAAMLLAQGQAEAAGVVNKALQPICHGAQSMAKTIRAGGTLFYAAAGSSGLMAAADAMELRGTFGISTDQIRIAMAGGLPTDASMPGGTEDSFEGLQQDLDGLAAADTMIAVSASGRTPYTLEAVAMARQAGAFVIGIANNADCELLQRSDCSILLPTPPEVIAGSTRMGAGTAQKIALNMLSTLMALELGHVHDGMMVNLRADNSKLRTRAARIVSKIADVPGDVASGALEKARGNVKIATLHAAGAKDIPAASALLERADGRLRAALAQLSNTQ